jgi:excisionase family DNA binding protein
MRKRTAVASGQSLNAKLLLSIEEVAASLSLGRSMVYKLVMRGDIPSITVGRMRRIPVTSLQAYISAQLSALQKGA